MINIIIISACYTFYPFNMTKNNKTSRSNPIIGPVTIELVFVIS